MDHNREEWEGGDRREHWHIGREIPVAVVLALLIQTAGGIWWAASLTAKIDILQLQISELKSSRYTSVDAGRDAATTNIRFDNLERRVTTLEGKRVR